MNGWFNMGQKGQMSLEESEMLLSCAENVFSKRSMQNKYFLRNVTVEKIIWSLL